MFWCSIIGIPYLCGNKIGYQRIVTTCAKFVMCGINYYNKAILQSSTLRGYVAAVNTLFKLWGFKQPTNLSNPSYMAGIIINNLIKEETVASQRSPVELVHLPQASFEAIRHCPPHTHPPRHP
jgi:hypothetical protein